jgi:hypothetical protein
MMFGNPMSPSAVLMKYAGIVIAVVGVLAILLSPFYVVGTAHEESHVYGAAHPNRGSLLLVVGDCEKLRFELTEKGVCSIYHSDDLGNMAPLADHEIVELGYEGPVFEAISDSTPAKPSTGVRMRVLSGGYLSDFVRVPREALIISFLLLFGGVALARIGIRRKRSMKGDVK